MLMDTLGIGLRERVERAWVQDEERALLLQVNEALTPAWRERLEVRRCWRSWALTKSLLRVLVSTLQDAPVARAIAADDPEALDALIRPLDAKFAGWDVGSFDEAAPWSHARLVALRWLRGYPLGCCCRCGAFMGGDRSFGACLHGCARPWELPAPGIDAQSGDSLATACGD